MVMGIAPLMVIMGAVYHWFPLVAGKFLSENWENGILVNILGGLFNYFPMHYLDLLEFLEDILKCMIAHT